ncbi:RnfH family protein [Salinisphaera sp. USBA-960]|uniref:RnfH family protein n=1 Tax=Salinisphaera orenii TaxID=856731 RepID=UPI000DBE2C50|nr:RnfH family protein [Salifodinibacter halophilus]NNC25511.1 RnfH family protein [Salifodinibacter halophilus]
MADETLRVEVVFALPGRVWREAVMLPAASTVADAVAASGLASVCADETGEPPAGYGVYGRSVRPSEVLIDGQRVEIYRPLIIDPRKRRREREAR